MGRAYEWVQEHGLEGHPNALMLYIRHLEKNKSESEKDNDKIKSKSNVKR